MNTASFLFVLSPSTKFPCPPCSPWMFLVAYGKKSLGEILFKICLRQEIICNSGRQQTKSLTKISTENALEYLAFGKGLLWIALQARNLNKNL